VPSKRNILSVLAILLLFITVSAILIIADTKRMNRYYASVTEITKNDSINLVVNDVWMNHGYLYFNDKYYISESNVIYSSRELLEIYELEEPFQLMKRSLSDTIVLQNDNDNFIIVLRTNN
jgi:hypothetical protein